MNTLATIKDELPLLLFAAVVALLSQWGALAMAL